MEKFLIMIEIVGGCLQGRCAAARSVECAPVSNQYCYDGLALHTPLRYIGTWRFRMSDDSEITAMGDIAAIVEKLQEEQRGRVIRYVVERFNIGGVTGAKTPVVSARGDVQPEQSSEFEDFASLVDATHPATDPMRALVAGYWLQVCNGAASFDAQSANTELKHLGHASSNITSSLTALIGQKPALVLQLRKSGNTKQARKLYKVTESGVRKVKDMMSGNGAAE